MAELVNPGNSFRPDDDSYADTINRINEGGYCPFCSDNLHINHPRPILEETDNWITTENAWPYKGSQEHLLLIHRNHIETLGEMSAEAWKELQLVITGITKLRRIKGAALLMRFGDTKFNGASVAHLHAQLVSGPGTEGSEPVNVRVG